MNMQAIAAIVRLVAPLLAGAATYVGITINAEEIYILLAGGITIAAFVWAWWKNNNVTKAAQEAQQMLDILKAEHEDRSDEDDEEARG